MNENTKSLIKFISENDVIYKKILVETYPEKNEQPTGEAFERFKSALIEAKLDENFDLSIMDLKAVYVEIFL
jgi:hypothetical protein